MQDPVIAAVTAAAPAAAGVKDTLYLLTVIIGAGVAAQWIASRFRLPALLLLLASGLVLGPLARMLGIPFAIEPDELFGRLLQPAVSMAVAVVLFEGGLTLEWREAKHVGATLWRLIGSGLVVGFALTAVLAHYVGGLDWVSARVLGAILVVTGPTVILPMLRTARISLRPATLLKWEGIVNDPFGVLLAVFCLQLLTPEATFTGLFLQFLGWSIVSGFFGTLVGYLLGRALDLGLIIEHLKSPVMLASVLVVFGIGEAMHHEMGYVAVTVMGVVLANTENHSLEDIRRFKEQVTTLLVSVLFIVLAANIEPEHISALFGRPLILIALIVFVVRPVVVWVATLGSDLPWNERILVGWIAPRGVVAAAVAATFQPQLPGDGDIVPIVFGVIVATVLLHGFTIRPFARRLGLAAREGNGILIVGASVWVVSLGQALAKAGAYVVLADTRYRRVSRARQEGLEVHYGDVLAEEAAMELPMERVSWVLAATDDDHYNALSCLRFGPELGREAVYQLTPKTQERRSERESHMIGQTPWGESGEYSAITSRFWKGASFKVTTISDEYTLQVFRERNEDALPLFVMHQERLRVFANETELPSGSQLIYFS